MVFFGSKNAVHYFLKQKPDLLGAKIAAVGESTARTLEEYGIKASFIGKGSDIPTIGREFRSWCNGQRVLFPQSDLSLQSISILFPEDQKEDVVVYKTIIETHSVPESDVYVFTSPSNIDGFLLSNSLPKGSTVIAWGNSTKRALREKGIQAVQISDPTVGSLIEKLKEL